MLVDGVELCNLPAKREHVHQSVDQSSRANDCDHRKDLLNHQNQINNDVVAIPGTREEINRVLKIIDGCRYWEDHEPFLHEILGV